MIGLVVMVALVVVFLVNVTRVGYLLFELTRDSTDWITRDSLWRSLLWVTLSGITLAILWMATQYTT